MNAIRILPILLLGGLALFFASARWLPAEMSIERSLQIEAPPARVFRHLDTVEEWRSWYTGLDADTEVQSPARLVVRFEDGTARVLEITETSSPTLVAYRFFPLASASESASPVEPVDPVEGSFVIKQKGSDCRVTNRETAAVPLSYRWILYLAGDTLMGQVIERELHNLKSLVETGETHPP